MKRRVAVLLGGESQERDISQVTGRAVAQALRERGHDVTLVDTGRGQLGAGEAPPPRIGAEPPPRTESGETAALASRGPGALLPGSLEDVDCVFIALHGGWGEDGTVQALFELTGIPYTGSGVLGSALAMDKDRAKRVFRASGIATPDWIAFDCSPGDEPTEAELEAARKTLGGVVVVKPNAEGSTVGLSIVEPGGSLASAVRHAADFGKRVLLESFVPGRELTVGILGEEPLPVVEIVPEGGVYTYEAKYTQGKSRYEVPAGLPDQATRALQEAASHAFQALGCEGFARVDFRLPEEGPAQCLEVNTIPGMTPLSLLPMAAKAGGVSFQELCERLVEHAISRGTRRRPGSVEVSG